jgi:hypothetical protein
LWCAELFTYDTVNIAVAHYRQLIVAAHIHHERIKLNVIVILDPVQPFPGNQFPVNVVHTGYSVRLLALPSGVVPLNECALFNGSLNDLHEVILHQ